jgi:hypothetical protein
VPVQDWQISAKIRNASMQIMNTINTNARRLVVGSSGRFVRLDRIQLQNGHFAKKCEEHPAGGPDGFEEYEDLT